jgi:hypothetical protein
MMGHIRRDALLIGFAFAAGVVNTLAGGGTLLTFPALNSPGIGDLNEVWAVVRHRRGAGAVGVLLREAIRYRLRLQRGERPRVV